METFTLNEMQEMQKKLQEKYQGKWEPIEIETGKNKMLWMIAEMGEVIDIVKKNGAQKAVTEPALRNDLVEELADVLMFYNDILLCYGITPEELKQADVTELIYQFMAVDALIAAGLKEKVEKMKADFGIGE